MNANQEREALCAIVQKHLATRTKNMENYSYFSSNPGVSEDDYEEIAAAIAADIQAAREADFTEWLTRTGLSNDASEVERQLLERLNARAPAAVPQGWVAIPLEPTDDEWRFAQGTLLDANWDALTCFAAQIQTLISITRDKWALAAATQPPEDAL